MTNGLLGLPGRALSCLSDIRKTGCRELFLSWKTWSFLFCPLAVQLLEAGLGKAWGWGPGSMLPVQLRDDAVPPAEPTMVEHGASIHIAGGTLG